MASIENVRLSYRIDGVVRKVVLKPGRDKSDDGIEIELASEKVNEGVLINCSIITDRTIEILEFSADTDIRLKDRKVLVNGYQTWTESVEAGEDYNQRRLNLLAMSVLKPYGDYSFYKYKKKPGFVHSYTYICLKDSEEYQLLGSLDETIGFTIFEADYNTNLIRIVKESDGIVINGRHDMLKLYIGQGNEKWVWDGYSKLFKEQRVGQPHRQHTGKCIGWTSWYNYYTNITEDIVIQNLNNMHKGSIPLEVFQIDDGYQQAVGDWLHVNKKFPKGMKYITDEIKRAGYKPGLWLAPFICERKSDVFKNHYQWVLKDSKGQPVKAGWNPNWSGTFYCLDIYDLKFREYLKNVFDTVLNIWGYEMVKLDFLYGAALQPKKDSTKGKVMDDAMGLVRDLCGDKWILGCGVPLGSAFDKVEYCRIGADVSPYWEDSKLKALGYQERVSTRSALNSTIGRYNLNGRFFMNDPDVFILRARDNKLNANQRYTLFFINNLLGSLIFFSDNIEEYNSDEMYKFKSIFPSISPEILHIKREGDFLNVEFKISQMQYISFSNLSKYKYKVKPKDGLYYYKEGEIIDGSCEIELKPYETRCLLKVTPQMPGNMVHFIGSDGYIFPSAEIETISISGDVVNVKYKEGYINESRLYFIVDISIDKLLVNNKVCISREVNGKRMIVS